MLSIYLKNSTFHLLHSRTTQYTHFTDTIRAASQRQFHELQVAMADMAQIVTTAGITSGETFPFVRVPYFEVPAGQARELSGVEMFSFNPLIATAQRNQWNTFAQKEQGWYNESKAILLAGSDPTLLHPTTYTQNTTLRNFIWRGTADGGVEEVPPPGPYAPIWQCSPPPFSPDFINYNMLSEQYAIDMLPVLLKTHDGLVSLVNPTLGRLAGIAVDPGDHESFHNQYVTSLVNDSAFDHPHSVHLQPVFEGINDDSSRIVGFLSSVIPWDRYMGNLLPKGVNNIVAVLKNTCNQSFTYVLKGPRVSFKYII